MIAFSSGEAEYTTLSYCGKMLEWLRRRYCKMCNDKVLSHSEPNMYAISLYCHSTAAASILSTPNISERKIHIALKYYHVKELIKIEFVNVAKIRTGLQTADFLTKAVRLETPNKLRLLCGFRL